MVGIITYGAYIPRYRIKVDEIARVWGANAAEISGGLGVFEKAVPDYDENTATFAVEAARAALARREVDVSEIKAVYVGSESHPYAVKPTAVTVGEAIGATPVMTAKMISTVIKPFLKSFFASSKVKISFFLLIS